MAKINYAELSVEDLVGSNSMFAILSGQTNPTTTKPSKLRKAFEVKLEKVPVAKYEKVSEVLKQSGRANNLYFDRLNGKIQNILNNLSKIEF